ncbi:uncharacterized protein PAC_01195 [Phialocephala subalpina]|uniref:Uncharacterized protein n=1 Tax=Phialocephala subalpina TaxID=576137 RepID=A0A1L7WEW0_9HELO|nr:uncharacterized protein PAC_01195 [Phialocephala subalpina]
MNPPGRPRLTTLADKYTHPVGEDHKEIAGTGKSGMTPSSSPIFPTGYQQRRYEALDAYQRRRFEAFSTREIEDVEAFAPLFPTTSLLFTVPTNQINPLFELNKWNVGNPNSVPLFRMPGQAGGYWQFNAYAARNNHFIGATTAYPAITPLPPDWNHVDSYPTPVPFFSSLLHPDFWTIHARKYVDTTKMGPKLLGNRYDVHNDTIDLISLADRLDKTDLPIWTSMTPTEVSETEYENPRRATATRIQKARDKAYARGQASVHAARYPNAIPSIPAPSTEQEEAPSCPRYQSIRQYIPANRGQGALCLDTMHFEMPENTLLNYIVLLGGIQPQITVEEWRAYLRIADGSGDLFRWRPDGRGVLTWAEAPPPGFPPPSPHPINAQSIKMTSTASRTSQRTMIGRRTISQIWSLILS